MLWHAAEFLGAFLSLPRRLQPGALWCASGHSTSCGGGTVQASEAGQPCEAHPGAPSGPRGHRLSCLSSDADDEEDEHHCLTASEAREAHAAEAAAARHFGGPDHPEPLYMPGNLDSCLLKVCSLDDSSLRALQQPGEIDLLWVVMTCPACALAGGDVRPRQAACRSGALPQALHTLFPRVLRQGGCAGMQCPHCHYAGRVLWLVPPEEATEDNLSSTDVSLSATPCASPRSSLEEVCCRPAQHQACIDAPACRDVRSCAAASL